MSLAATFARADAPEARREQYYEVLGNRAIYRDGWKAVVNHLVHAPDFSRDRWELYHVAEDYSEAHDVAALYPGKLAELRAEFLVEAGKNGVFPLLGGIVPYGPEDDAGYAVGATEATDAGVATDTVAADTETVNGNGAAAADDRMAAGSAATASAGVATDNDTGTASAGAADVTESETGGPDSIENVDDLFPPLSPIAQATFEHVARPFFIPRGLPPELSDRPDIDLDRASHEVEARVTLSSGTEGVIIAHGNRFGGFALFVQDGRLHYEVNSNRVRYYEAISEGPLPLGPATLGYLFVRDGAGMASCGAAGAATHEGAGVAARDGAGAATCVAAYDGVGTATHDRDATDSNNGGGAPSRGAATGIGATVTLLVNGKPAGSVHAERLPGHPLGAVELKANHFTEVSPSYRVPFELTAPLERITLTQLEPPARFTQVSLDEALSQD